MEILLPYGEITFELYVWGIIQVRCNMVVWCGREGDYNLKSLDFLINDFHAWTWILDRKLTNIKTFQIANELNLNLIIFFFYFNQLWKMDFFCSWNFNSWIFLALFKWLQFFWAGAGFGIVESPWILE